MSSFLFTTVMGALAGLDFAQRMFESFHVELSLLLIAVLIHVCYVQRVGASQAFKKPFSRLTGKGGSRETCSKPTTNVSSNQTSYVKKFAAAADTIFRPNAKTESPSPVEAIERALMEVPRTEKVNALAGLVQGALKSKSLKLGVLSAVRHVLKVSKLEPSTLLGELLSRGYWQLHLLDDLNALLRELAVLHINEPYIATWSMRSALQINDLPEALRQLERLRVHWKSNESSASGMKQTLLQKLVATAADANGLSMLMQKLVEFDLLSDSLSLVLSECNRRGDSATFEEAKRLSSSLHAKLPESSYCLLIQGAKTSAEAVHIVVEAADYGAFGNDLIMAAAEHALTQKDAALVNTILRKLPETMTAEPVGKILAFFTDGGLAAGKSPDDTILMFYNRHLSSIDLTGDTKSSRIIAEAAIRCNQTDLLAKLLVSPCDQGRKNAQLIKTFAESGQLSNALAVFSACSKKDGPWAYNGAADACIDCNDERMAKQILKEAVDAGVADVVTYTLMIKMHRRFGSNMRDSEKVIEIMREAGVQPNCVTYNELLDLKIKKSTSEGWKLVDQMRFHGIKPNHVTCSILLKTLQKTPTPENIVRVVRALDDMDGEMDEVLFNLVVEASIQIGRADLLPRYMKKLQESISSLKGIHTYNSIIRAYSFLKDINGVMDTWQELKKRRFVPNQVTIGCMVEALVSNSSTDAAYRLINEILADDQTKSQVNAVIYCTVLKGYSHEKNFKRVWSIYQEMLNRKLEFSIVTYNTLVDACARCGETALIPQIVKNMKEQGIEPDIITYSIILKSHCHENRVHDAFQVVDDMLQNTALRPDEVMYNTLLDGCARQGLYERGIALLAEMEQAGIPPSNFTLSRVVKLCSRNKLMDKAFELVDTISTKFKFQPNVFVYSNLVYSCIMHKDLTRAIGVVDLMLDRDVRPNACIYTTLLQACTKGGQAQQAAGLLRAAFGLRGVHPQLSSHSASALRPIDRMSDQVVKDTLAALSRDGHDELSAVLARELHAAKSSLHNKSGRA